MLKNELGSQGTHYSFFQNAHLQSIVTNVVVPGLRIRESDEEDFEDNPLEYYFFCAVYVETLPFLTFCCEKGIFHATRSSNLHQADARSSRVSFCVAGTCSVIWRVVLPTPGAG